MNIKRKVLSGAVLAMALISTGAAQAYIPENGGLTKTRQIVEHVAAVAPLGFQVFCLQNPGECKASQRGTATYSFALMRTLSQINRKVNRSMVARNDRGADTWTLNARTGDCEDFVLTKRSALIKAGIPAGALRIATARTRSGEGHAVLLVRTSRGDYVLDNRTSRIKPWDRTGLQMLSISGANPRNWSAIG